MHKKLLFLIQLFLLQNTSFAIDFFSSHFDDDFTRSAAFVVFKDGKILDKSITGCQIVKGRECIKKTNFDTPFQINSMSKQFTAASILLLVEKGLISEEDSITKYLPWLSKNFKPVTIKHLITHTGGMGDYLNDANADFDQFYEDGLIVNNEFVKNDILKNVKYSNKKYVRYNYSNNGYVLLSMIVEKVSGLSFSDFLQKEIFSKLQMKNSFLIDGKHNRDDCLKGHSSWPFNIRKDRDLVFNETGDRGICTSINDYLKWINALENNQLFAKTKTHKKFLEPVLVNNQHPVFKRTVGKNIFTYGYGLRHGFLRDNIPLFYHAGHVRGTTSLMVKFIEHNTWFVMLTNTDFGEIDSFMFDVFNKIKAI
ncbi:MAG: penicillin-binding protein 4* [Pseudomonadota bacterium]|jgi:CubicO group peptidase (beta-lactamase class C family)